MSKQIDDGGPVYPIKRKPPTAEFLGAGPPKGDSEGMTLRDWFAGQALAYTADLCTNTENPWEVNAARQAYELADAMIAEKRRTEATP